MKTTPLWSSGGCGFLHLSLHLVALHRTTYEKSWTREMADLPRQALPSSSIFHVAAVFTPLPSHTHPSRLGLNIIILFGNQTTPPTKLLWSFLPPSSLTTSSALNHLPFGSRQQLWNSLCLPRWIGSQRCSSLSLVMSNYISSRTTRPEKLVLQQRLLLPLGVV